MIQLTGTAYAVFIFVVIMVIITFSDNRTKLFIWLLLDFSGLRFLYRKMRPEEEVAEKNESYRRPSTFLVWFIGIYIVIFGIASKNYENRVDVIEDRINGIYAQSSEHLHFAFERIDDTQNMTCPVKPEFSDLISVVQSFSSLKEAKYEEGVEQLKRLVEDWAQKMETIKSRLKKEPLAEVWIKKIKKTVKEKRLDYNKQIGQLAFVDLQKVNLENAKLKDAHLEVADLSYASLSGAQLESAHLDSAVLWYAHLDGADLRSAFLERADLRSASLAGAELWFTNLKDADLRSVNLEHAVLRYAQLAGANLMYANLTKADLSYAYLKGANLAKTDLKDADLRFTNLEDVELEDANLENACLCEANLKNTKLTLEQLSKTFSLYSVKYLDPELEEQIREQYPHLLEPNKCNDKFKTEGFLK
jgi:uncharacterized protein YjbI with pentapeptide repeats